MMFANATNVYRKSGGAERRDLRFYGPFVEMFFDGTKPTCPGVPWRDLRCAIRVPRICRSTATLPFGHPEGARLWTVLGY